jgi:hypothetical protein
VEEDRVSDDEGPTITGRRYWYHRDIEKALAEGRDPTYWVIERGIAILCIVLTFLAGFAVGAALVVWLVLK